MLQEVVTDLPRLPHTGASSRATPSRLGASSKSKPAKREPNALLSGGISRSALQSKFAAFSLKIWWWDVEIHLRVEEGAMEERELSFGLSSFEWTVGEEDCTVGEERDGINTPSGPTVR